MTAGTSAGTLAASSLERYIALNGLLVLATSLRTAPPALPEAPVTSIMVILLWLSNPKSLFDQEKPRTVVLELEISPWSAMYPQRAVGLWPRARRSLFPRTPYYEAMKLHLLATALS